MIICIKQYGKMNEFFQKGHKSELDKFLQRNDLVATDDSHVICVDASVCVFFFTEILITRSEALRGTADSFVKLAPT